MQGARAGGRVRRLAIITTGAGLILALLPPSIAFGTTYTITAGFTPTNGSTAAITATSSVWETARTAANGVVAPYTFNMQVYDTYSSSVYSCRRCWLYFDLSSIPGSATITGATFTGYPSSNETNTFYEPTGAPAPPATSADYSYPLGVPVASFSTTSVVTFAVPLPAYTPGLWVVGIGYQDAIDLAPTTNASLLIYSPTLYVTYTLPVSSTTNISIVPTISLTGTLPVSFDTTALVAAIWAGEPTQSASATSSEPTTVGVWLEGVGSWGGGALDVALCALFLTIGAAVPVLWGGLPWTR